MSTKVCTLCKVKKPLSCFYKRKVTYKPNATKRQKANYNRNQVLPRCKACESKTTSKRRNADPVAAEKIRRKAHLKNYGLTPGDYDKLFEEQSGKCKICGTTDPGASYKYLSVDHDHETGEVRGLLCNSCNRALGFFKDDTNLLECHQVLKSIRGRNETISFDTNVPFGLRGVSIRH